MSDLEARLYDVYRASFEKAERERRWSVFDDVPWDRAKSDQIGRASCRERV